MQVLERYKTLEPLETMDILIAPENIRKNLKSENDIYKFEYCSLDEKTYKIASYIPLEWKNGKLEKVLLASMDVTQEKKAEIESRQALKEAYRSAENANRAKTEFLSNMSHDIRTPMNAIVGLTAIAGANVESQDRVIECLSKITESSRHLLGLINEVLDMARIESGKMTLAQEDFNLSELVDNLITLTKPVLDEHKHNFDIHINHIEHEDVCGDSLRIQQVFVNLMSNAIKYTPDGGNIIFSIEEKPNGFSELGCYEFTIEDNGIGITGEWVLSGREAVECCYARHELKNDYFAVILDWKMPDMDGYKATQAIRRLADKKKAGIPIIAMTANAFGEDRKKGIGKRNERTYCKAC